MKYKNSANKKGPEFLQSDEAQKLKANELLKNEIFEIVVRWGLYELVNNLHQKIKRLEMDKTPYSDAYKIELLEQLADVNRLVNMLTEGNLSAYKTAIRPDKVGNLTFYANYSNSPTTENGLLNLPRGEAVGVVSMSIKIIDPRITEESIAYYRKSPEEITLNNSQSPWVSAAVSFQTVTQTEEGIVFRSGPGVYIKFSEDGSLEIYPLVKRGGDNYVIPKEEGGIIVDAKLNPQLGNQFIQMAKKYLSGSS